MITNGRFNHINAKEKKREGNGKGVGKGKGTGKGKGKGKRKGFPTRITAFLPDIKRLLAAFFINSPRCRTNTMFQIDRFRHGSGEGMRKWMSLRDNAKWGSTGLKHYNLQCF